MNAVWCNVRGCWIVRHPQRGDIVATGKSKAQAEERAAVAMREERLLVGP